MDRFDFEPIRGIDESEDEVSDLPLPLRGVVQPPDSTAPSPKPKPGR